MKVLGSHFFFWTELVREHLVFLSKLFEFWNCEAIQFFSSTESVCEIFEVFKQAISAVKIFNFSKMLQRRNWFPIFFSCKNWFFWSILFEFWKFEIFEVILKAVTILEKFEISKQETWAKPWKFHNKNQFAKVLKVCLQKLLKPWSFELSQVISSPNLVRKKFLHTIREQTIRELIIWKTPIIFLIEKIATRESWVFAYKLIEL